MDEAIVKQEGAVSMPGEIAELATALSKAQALMEPAVKDSENPFFKSRYADLAAVWGACREPLTKNGLSVVQLAKAQGNSVTITTMLLHSSGQYISNDLTMRAEKDTPQGIGSAITYARRYALSAIVGISSEDDDGNETEGKVVNTKPAVKTPQPKQLSIEERFANAKKSLGEEKFFKILGEAGFQSSDDVNFLEADDVLNKMAKAYREKNVKV